MKVKIRKFKLVRTRYGSTARRLRLAYVINKKQCLVFVASKIVGGCLVDSPEMDHLAGCCPHNADKYLLCKDREKKKPRILFYSSHRLKKMLVYKISRTHGYLFDKYKVNRGHEMALCIGCKRENSRRPTITHETPVRGAVSGNTLLFDPRRGHISGCKPLPIDEIKRIVTPNRHIKQEIKTGRYMTTIGAVVQGQPLNVPVMDHSVSLEHCDLDMDAVEATIDYKRQAVGNHYGPTGDEKRSDTPALASHDDSNEFIVDPEVSHHTLSFAQEELEDGMLTGENGARNYASFGKTEGLVSGSKRHGFQASDDARPKVQPRSKCPEVITISDDENNCSLIDKEGTTILSSDDEDMEIAFSLIRQQEAMLKAFETKRVTTYAATKVAPAVERKLVENKPVSQAELPTDESMVMDLSEPGVAISAPQTKVADGDTEESQCSVERIVFVSAEAEKGYFVEEQVLAMGAVGHNKTMDIDSAVNRAALKEIEYQAVNGEGGVGTPPVIENNCAHPKFVDAELNNEQEPMTLAEIACGYVAGEETETGQVLEKRSGEVDQAERSHEVVFVATSRVSSIHRMITRSKDSCKRKATKYGCEQPVAKITVLHDSGDVSDADDKPLSHWLNCNKTMHKRICQEKSAKFGVHEESSNGLQSPSDDTDDEEFKSHVSIQQHFRPANIRAHKADPSTISLFEDRPITERREVFVMPRYSPKLLKKSTWVHPDNRQLRVQEIQEDAAPSLLKLVDAMNPAVIEREFAVFDNLPMPELGENDSLSDLDLFSLDDEDRAWFENLFNNTDLENQYVEDGEENDLFGPYQQ